MLAKKSPAGGGCRSVVRCCGVSSSFAHARLGGSPLCATVAVYKKRFSPGSVQRMADSFEARATEEEKPQAVLDVMAQASRVTGLIGTKPMEALSVGAIKKGPAFRTGPDHSAIYFHVNAWAPFSPDFHIRFSHTPTLLDCHIGLADAPPDCHVGGTGAVFAA